MSVDVHHRTCPLCEATCGLEISVRDGRVARIRGDVEDVFSHGFLCPKGSTLKQLHEDPDRLRSPMVRRGTALIEASWDEAFSEIDARLGAIVREHGPDSVGIYLGNPNVHGLAGAFWLRPLLRSFGTRNLFTASTVDQMPRHVSSGLMFGDPFAYVIPDIDRTDHLLMLGANPFESNGSLATAPDWPGRMQAISRRGGRVVVVDPRRTRTAAAADEHIFIRPGTDAVLLCALVNVIAVDGLVRTGEAGDHLRGLDVALTAVAGFSPALAAEVTGIDASTIRRLAHELAAAERAVVYGRLGVHAVPDGTIGSWATDVLNIITGNLDRPGGAMWGESAHARPLAPSGGGRGFRIGRWASRVSGLPEVTGELPVAALAEEIETPGAGQVRAMIVIGGNPVLSTPESERLDRALGGLDFMVSVDMYLNETSRHADVLLSVPSQLEKSHYDAAFYDHAIRRVANWSPRVFASGGPSEADVLARLTLIARGKGPLADPNTLHEEILVGILASASGDEHSNVTGRDVQELRAMVTGDATEDRIVDALVRTGPFGDGFGADPAGVTLAVLQKHPHGIDFGPLRSRLPAILRTPDARIDLAPELIVDAVPALLQRARVAAGDGLVLIGRRHVRSNNSWMHNIDVLVRGKERCSLQINPADAHRRGLRDGDLATVRSRVGSLTVAVEVTDDVMPGVVCLPHGWGHSADGARPSVAMRHPGVNTNVLTDGSVLDHLCGNATLNAIPVNVERAA